MLKVRNLPQTILHHPLSAQHTHSSIPIPTQTPDVQLLLAESPTPTADSRLLALHQKILQRDLDAAA